MVKMQGPNSKRTSEELSKDEKIVRAAIAVKQLKEEERSQRFDPYVKGSRATPAQQVVIDSFSSYEYRNYFVRGGNQSGKTVTCAYLIAHLLMENLPNWQRLKEWGDAPIMILWAVRQSRHISGSLWPKLRPHLKVGTYREINQGGILQRVVMNNGNELIFLNYQNINEATDAAASFTIQYAFVDELPSKAKFIEELQNRVLKMNGIFMAAFTPKRPAPEVRRIVENSDPRFTTGFKLRFLDNPGMSEQSKEMQIAKAKQYGDQMAHTILEGDWVAGDSQVFYIDEAKVVRQLPSHYDRLLWRHVESSDPAYGSGFGLLVMAEDPRTNLWYVVKAKVLSGQEIECPSISVESVIKHTSTYNIWRRQADPAALSYVREARKMGLKYSLGPNKQEDFEWFIDSVQEAIGRRVFITPEANDLLDQMSEYQRSPDNPDHIINRKKFHLIDAFRYAVVMLPKLKDEKLQAPVDDTPFNPQKYLEDKVWAAKEAAQKKPLKFREKLRIVNTALWGRR